MEKKMMSTRGRVARRYGPARSLTRRSEALGYTLTTGDDPGDVTCVATNRATGRTLIATADDGPAAIRSLAVVLGLLDAPQEDRFAPAIRSSSR